MVSSLEGARTGRRGRLGLLAALALCLAWTLASAPEALAHAQLLGTSPAAGSTVRTQPREVIFKFNQAVGGTLGAVRVYNSSGEQVDDLRVSHSYGNEHWLGVGLRAHLPDGTYTATYRVISADTHIVYGGLVFNLGHAGAAPRFTVASLIGRDKSGEVTTLAFGAIRALDYLSIAMAIGVLAFLLVSWLPALASSAGSERRWQTASQAFATRARRLLWTAIALGLVVSVLGVLLQGASAAGVSLWSSLKGSVVQSTIESRFGTVWGLRALDWIAIAALLSSSRVLGAQLPPTLTSEDGCVGVGRIPPALLLALALACLYLAMTPALAGHASIESPVAVFFPTDVVHVLAASVWVGGIICLLVALPAATRALRGSERSLLLWSVLARFSPLALGSVLAIAATGAIQAYIDVRSIDGLLHTTYGQLVLVKTALLVALIWLGWVNRSRVIPALKRLTGAERSPGGAGVLARRSLRAELGLMLCVLVATSALVAYAPPIDAASGPFSKNTTIGPAELELTVEPARAGPNTIHLYLIDAKTGAQYTATKELTVTARLPSKAIGPLPLKANVAGPGHYVLNSAVLSPGGDWIVEVVNRVSEFQQYSREVKVPIK